MDNNHNSQKLPTRWWGLLIRIVVAIVILFAANLLIGGILMSRLPESIQTSPYGALAWAVGAVLVFLLVVGCTKLWLQKVEHRSLASAGFVWSRNAGIGLLVGTLISVGIVTVAMLLGQVVAPNAEPMAATTEDLGQAPLWVFIVLGLAQSYLLQGIPEELLFRGWLQSVIPNQPLKMLAWTTTSFTIIHLASQGGQQNLLEHFLYLMIPLGFGFMAGVLTIVTGNFWMAPGIHGGFHVGTIVAAMVVPFHMAAVDWVLVGLVYLAVAVPVLVVWTKRRQANAISSSELQRV